MVSFAFRFRVKRDRNVGGTRNRIGAARGMSVIGKLVTERGLELVLDDL